MAEFDMNRQYLVLVTADEQGNATGLRARLDPQLGTVVRLFSSKEKLEAFFEQSDENQRFLDILEWSAKHYTSEDLNIGAYVEMTIRELAPWLEAYNVDHLQVDPGTPGGWNRVYPSPHKA